MSYVDTPVNSASDDAFGFHRYRDALLKVVRDSNAPSDTPLTVGIFGPWGSGKTSLMRLVYEDLPKQTAERHWHAVPVWFDAWQYGQQEQALWRALIVAVLDVLRADPALQSISEELDRIEASLYRTVEWQELGKWTIDWARALTGTVRGATQLASAFVPGARSLAEIIEQTWILLAGESTSDEQLKQVAHSLRREVQKYRREQLSSLEQFQRDFARLIQQHVVARNKRLVIFIDDLDRCLPEKAVEVLETLKLFLSVEGCFFFIAADREVIERGIQVRYKSFLIGAEETIAESIDTGQIPITGRDYIEKIIQLPFSLPPLEKASVEEFITRLYPDLADCSSICAAGLEANPRKVKRVLNVLRLLISLQAESFDTSLLAKIVVIQSRYPKLYAQLFDYPSLLRELERYFQQGADAGSLPPDDDTQAQTLYRLRNTYISYKALGDMLRLPPLFGSLSRAALERYLYLTRATSDDKRVIIATDSTETSIWDDLQSGDLTRVSEAVQRLKSSSQSESYAARIGAMLERPELTPRERLSLGLAWGMLDYPRDRDDRVSVPGTSFRLGKYPVTNAQYRHFLEAGGYTVRAYWDEAGWKHAQSVRAPRYWENGLWNQPTQPVVGVNWFEARAYCRWLSEQQQRPCRLPTGSEWLAAAGSSAGTEGTASPAYPWGSGFDPSRANTYESGLGVTTPVGCYPLGVSRVSGAYDLIGNVWEWTADDGYGPDSKVLRGGSWFNEAKEAQMNRTEPFEALPSHQASSVGFRVLCE